MTAPLPDGGWGDDGGWGEPELHAVTEPSGWDDDPGDLRPDGALPDSVAAGWAEEPEQLPAVLARDTGRALADWRDPDLVTKAVGDVRRRVLEEVRGQYGQVLTGRPEGRVTEATVAPELAFLTSAHYALAQLADAIKAGADEARQIAGEVLVDVSGDERKRATVKVADVYGGIVAKREVPSEVSVRQDDVLDVLVASLLAEWAVTDTGAAGNPEATAYARGARDALAALLPLTSPPKWKSTALDALTRKLEEAGEDALALRLSHAYGRVSKGNPRVTLEREEAKP